jgi:hypothetical protein
MYARKSPGVAVLCRVQQQQQRCCPQAEHSVQQNKSLNKTTVILHLLQRLGHPVLWAAAAAAQQRCACDPQAAAALCHHPCLHDSSGLAITPAATAAMGIRPPELQQHHAAPSACMPATSSKNGPAVTRSSCVSLH